mgnify:CR=1 FL=1
MGGCVGGWRRCGWVDGWMGGWVDGWMFNGVWISSVLEMVGRANPTADRAFSDLTEVTSGYSQ